MKRDFIAGNQLFSYSIISRFSDLNFDGRHNSIQISIVKGSTDFTGHEKSSQYIVVVVGLEKNREESWWIINNGQE